MDLTAASCVHLFEPQWNPMVEAQALHRVHRIGQDRDVVITRYIVRNSIENVSILYLYLTKERIEKNTALLLTHTHGGETVCSGCSTNKVEAVPAVVWSPSPTRISFHGGSISCK